MKKIILTLAIITIMTTIFSGNLMAQTEKKSLKMLIDINPYVNINLGDDINISIDQPWQGGKIRQASSELYIKTNTEIELSWESTTLTNKKTGRKLPLGIPTDFIQKLIQGEKVKASEQAFGLNSFLVKKEIKNNFNVFSDEFSHNRYYQKVKSQFNKNKSSTLESKIINGEKLQSKQAYKLEAGIHDFDLIVQYYLAEEGSWSKIAAGEYTGEIVYTVSAVGNGNE